MTRLGETLHALDNLIAIEKPLTKKERSARTKKAWLKRNRGKKKAKRTLMNETGTWWNSMNHHDRKQVLTSLWDAAPDDMTQHFMYGKKENADKLSKRKLERIPDGAGVMELVEQMYIHTMLGSDEKSWKDKIQFASLNSNDTLPYGKEIIFAQHGAQYDDEEDPEIPEPRSLKLHKLSKSTLRNREHNRIRKKLKLGLRSFNTNFDFFEYMKERTNPGAYEQDYPIDMTDWVSDNFSTLATKGTKKAISRMDASNQGSEDKRVADVFLHEVMEITGIDLDNLDPSHFVENNAESILYDYGRDPDDFDEEDDDY